MAGPSGARRIRAYVGLGANVGAAAETLERAVGALAALPGVRLRGVSRLYVTRPVGVANQRDFHNAVVALDATGEGTDADAALALLARLKDLEREFGRRRRRRWGPRELDLDLLVFGDARLDVPRTPEARSVDAPAGSTTPDRLVVPHPAAGERLFVLAPLADLAPRLVPPGWDRTVDEARRRQVEREGPDAIRVVADWHDGRQRWERVQPR